MEAEDVAPLPSPDRSPYRLLKQSSGKTDSFSSPVPSLAPSDITSEHSSFRKSIDRGLDRLKERRRESPDKDGDSSSPKRSTLSKLVHKSSRRRRKRDKEGDPLHEHSPDGGLLGVPGQNNSKLHLDSANASTDSLGNPRSSPSSLLLTDDSEPDVPTSRPELVSRASHKGFLTFSSPLIATEPVDAKLAPSSPDSPIKAAAFPPASALPPHLADSSLNRSNSDPSKSDAARPASASSSKPSIKVTTFPPDSRPSTPSTFITPPTPVVKSPTAALKSSSSSSLALPPLSAKPPSAIPKEKLSHRRVRSAAAASKKSASANPLTPHVEEVRTPGGSVINPSASSGFFSGFFTTAQNAVTQISNTLANQPVLQRTRSTTQSSKQAESDRGSDTAFERGVLSDPDSETSAQPEPAIATLGAGNLSLTHLGIVDQPSEASGMATTTESSTNAPPRPGHDASASTEEVSAADAVSAAYHTRDPSEKSVPLIADSIPGRPRSIGSHGGGGIAGDQTPPRFSAIEPDAGSILRAGSVRSRLSGTRRKHRNSSVAGGAIAAAVAASNGAIANPASRRPTGFQVANSRRNKEFHQLFKSVPEDDHLIDDYSAALQRDILLHGRFYISERHICFSSNILGWVTNLVISFDEVLAMEKKSTAMIFPNAIVIQTLHAKNVFASFISRDPTYDLLVRIWKIGHPNIKSTEAGHILDESQNGDSLENGDGAESDDEEDGSTDDDDDDTDPHADGGSSIGRPASILSEVAETHRQVSKATVAGGSPGTAANGSQIKAPETVGAPGTAGAPDFAGPLQHGPTECSDQDTHYDKQVLDTVVPAPLGQVYSMMFGPQSGVVMRKFLIDDQKSTELQLEDDKKGINEENKTASFSYIKPLSAPVGPKQTKCIVNQTLDAFDLEKAVSVTCSTSTPDVPSGNIFVTKTRYCLTWGASNQTRVVMTATVEWSGKSWLKGPIEKGAGDGQIQYGKDIAAFLKAQVAARSPTKASKGKGKGKKKKSSSPDATDNSARAEKPTAKKGASTWGPLEPLHAILSAVGDIAGPILSPVTILSILLLVMSIMWYRQTGTSREASLDLRGLPTPQRMAAYDQLWKREESQLWDWLEDRLSLDDVASVHQTGKVARRDDDQAGGSADMAEKLREQRMNDRQVDDAIRVTEERLKDLKRIVERQKGGAA